MKILVVLGPTASGKSALAVELARRFDGEVVSADSRQVYRGLDIGSGKVTKREMRGIRHHLLDVASPRRTFTVTDYQRLARRAVADIARRGKLPIVCGGTGLYIDALVYDRSFPDVPPNHALRKELDRRSAAALYDELERRDPERAASIDRHNKRRLLRAIEIVDALGAVPPVRRGSAHYATLTLGLRPPPATLRRKIHRRLHGRWKRGMASEVQHLHERGVSWKRMEALGLEYRFASAYLRGAIEKTTMLEQLERDIIRYAKRQMTWFKRDAGVLWVRTRSEAMKATRTFLKGV